jgi:integrase
VRQAKDLNRQVEHAVSAPKRALRPQGRTITDLVENYRKSPAWSDLSDKSRQSYSRLLAQIERKWGNQLVVDFTKPVMAQWYETVLGTGKTRMAQALIRMMSILFSRAETIGWRAEGSNPCFRLKMRSPGPRRASLGWEGLDALVAAADGLGLHAIGTACLLLALQGQRSTDVRKARRGDFHLHAAPGAAPVWLWVLRRQKRGTDGVLPLHPEVETRLRPVLLAADSAADAPLLLTPDGQPYSEDLFIKHFNRARAVAVETVPGLDGLQMRDLRRSFGILARQGGATIEDVGDVLGNTAARDPSLKDIYMPATLATTARAVAAIKRPERKHG